MLWQIVLASIAISIFSLVGIFALAASKNVLDKIILLLVALAAGTMMGNVFFHLLPEAIELLPARESFLVVLISFMVFFAIEKGLQWHHCHSSDHNNHPHTIGYMNLIGDFVHNFTDGLVLAAAFIASLPIGIATAVAIALHEIPQEIGDFGVLIHSGFSKLKALMLNFVVALGSLAGALVGYYIVSLVPSLESYLIPAAAGGFLYIAAADLLPEIREESKSSKILLSSLAFVVGVLIMYLFFNGAESTHELHGVEDAHVKDVHEEEGDLHE